MDENVAIRISEARKTYSCFLGGRKTVVDGLGFEVPRGTIHGLLGPNGAGKTTTIKMLLGLVRADGGDFEIMGRDPRSRAGRVGVGFLPEQPYFPVHLKAERALRLYGRLVNVDQADLHGQVSELLDLVGLARYADVQLSKFSRGMLQRFGIAQALVGNPRVVVFDEPASGLDPIGQRDMRNLMLDLREKGVTILLSSHRLSEIEVVCDRVTIVDAGRVASEGDIDALLNVEGRTSLRVRDLLDGLPSAVAGLVDDIAASGGEWIFSVADADVRTVLNEVERAGGRLVSLNPKRESLEDYFSRMLADGIGSGGGQ